MKRLLDLIRRSVNVLDFASLQALYNSCYKSIIWSHLEYYGNVVWFSRFKGDKDKLERMQRWTFRLAFWLLELDFVGRLKMFDLPSLYYRSVREEVVEYYKYLRGVYDVLVDFLS